MYINRFISNKDSLNLCLFVKVFVKYYIKYVKYNRFIVWFYEMFFENLKKDSVSIDLILSGRG